MVPIVETFYSIQGEGKRSGIPSVFVRTGLCNFKCEGFGCSLKAPDGTEIVGCDSIRAVSSKFKDLWDYYVEYLDLVDRIDKTMPTLPRENLIRPDIVLTGGEPLIHWKEDVVQRTLSHYISRGHKITIETNASLDIEFKRKYQEEIIFSMSVKLSNSGEPEHKRVNIENITNILEHSPESYLKFVVSKKTWNKDWNEIKNILRDIPIFVDVYLMPMGETIDEVHENCLFVMEKCVELGLKYSDRLHIRAWNDKPGV